jgi:DNA repair photolyase
VQQRLFQIEPAPRVSRLARRAAEGTVLEEKRAVDYRELPSRSLLNRCNSTRVPFRWTINPYRGCEFACQYCYARYTHEFLELRDPRDFEDHIYAKTWNRDAFRHDLARVPLADSIALGTATDPYQPAERRFGITRRILGEFARESGRRFCIATKSGLVLRDLDLLTAISRRNLLTVAMTITTLDPELARLLEPRAPRPDLRVAALAALGREGIRTGVLCCPILPYINDSADSLEAVFAAAARAGASWAGGNVLFLRSSAAAVFLPFVDRHFPELASRYRALFAREAFVRGSYPAGIRKIVDWLQVKYGLTAREPTLAGNAYEHLPQLSLQL